MENCIIECSFHAYACSCTKVFLHSHILLKALTQKCYLCYHCVRQMLLVLSLCSTNVTCVITVFDKCYLCYHCVREMLLVLSLCSSTAGDCGCLRFITFLLHQQFLSSIFPRNICFSSSSRLGVRRIKDAFSHANLCYC